MSEDTANTAPICRLSTASLVLSFIVLLAAVAIAPCFHWFVRGAIPVNSPLFTAVVSCLRVFLPIMLLTAPATPVLAIIAIARIRLSKGKLCGYRRALISMLIVGVTVVLLAKWLTYCLSCIPNFPF